jgi:hypothetical protein
MKPRHAAALALVGWYLITPPTSKNAIHDDLPLSKWEKVGTLDTASQCEDALKDLDNPSIDQHMQETVTPEEYKSFKQFMDDAKCVSSADPRLKPK